MNNEAFFTAIDSKFLVVQKKYIDKGRTSPGGTATAMIGRLEAVLTDTPELEKELLEIANSLIKENGIIITDELKEGLQIRSMNVLRAITNYRIVGKLPIE